MPSSADNDFVCKQCGSEVHPNAKACAQCGARRGTPRARSARSQAWHQEEHLDGIDLPDATGDDFDYDEFIAREFGESAAEKSSAPRDWKKFFWWLTALITLIAFTLLAIRW